MIAKFGQNQAKMIDATVIDSDAEINAVVDAEIGGDVEMNVIATPVTSETIAERAYLHHVRRGCVHGFDVEDWLKAEKELIKESLS